MELVPPWERRWQLFPVQDCHKYQVHEQRRLVVGFDIILYIQNNHIDHITGLLAAYRNFRGTF